MQVYAYGGVGGIPLALLSITCIRATSALDTFSVWNRSILYVYVEGRIWRGGHRSICKLCRSGSKVNKKGRRPENVWLSIVCGLSVPSHHLQYFALMPVAVYDLCIWRYLHPLLKYKHNSNIGWRCIYHNNLQDITIDIMLSSPSFVNLHPIKIFIQSVAKGCYLQSRTTKVLSWLHQNQRV